MHPRTPLWLVASTLLALLLSVAALAIATMVWIDHGAKEIHAQDRPRMISASELEAVMDIRLPAGATVLTAVRKPTGRGLEYRTWGKVRMPRAALAGFLADSGLPELRPGDRVITDATLPGSDTWRPDAAKVVAGAKDNVCRVMADLDHPVEITVYLFHVQL